MKNGANDTDVKQELKLTIKKNIARAWYKLDQPSYERWLEGRRSGSSELQY